MENLLNLIITNMYLLMPNMDIYIDIVSVMKGYFTLNLFNMDIHMDIVSMMKNKA